MEELLGLLKKAAPWLAAAAGGPAGIAAMAVKTVAEKLGASGETAQELTAALSGAKPEQIAALKAADQEFAIRMKSLGFDNIQALERIAADDRKDARAMQIAVRSNIPGVLAIGITLGFFTILGFMLTGVWKAADNQALLILLGSLGTSWGAVVNYYFGSSASSARKDALIAAKP